MSGGDCWPISVPMAVSSGGRLWLADLLLGTFRVWFMVNGWCFLWR